MCATSAGLVGPSDSSHASSSLNECGVSNTAKDLRPNSSGSRSRETSKRRTRTGPTRDSPAGYSFRHVT